jgi:hypothetical protein
MHSSQISISKNPMGSHMDMAFSKLLRSGIVSYIGFSIEFSRNRLAHVATSAKRPIDFRAQCLTLGDVQWKWVNPRWLGWNTVGARRDDDQLRWLHVQDAVFRTKVAGNANMPYYISMRVLTSLLGNLSAHFAVAD